MTSIRVTLIPGATGLVSTTVPLVGSETTVNYDYTPDGMLAGIEVVGDVALSVNGVEVYGLTDPQPGG